MGSDKVFDGDGDIIDYQVAIIEYANGVGMNFHTNLNVPDQFRRFAIMGSRGMAEGDFIRGFTSMFMKCPSWRQGDREEIRDANGCFPSTTAPTNRWPPTS